MSIHLNPPQIKFLIVSQIFIINEQMGEWMNGRMKTYYIPNKIYHFIISYLARCQEHF